MVGLASAILSMRCALVSAPKGALSFMHMPLVHDDAVRLASDGSDGEDVASGAMAIGAALVASAAAATVAGCQRSRASKGSQSAAPLPATATSKLSFFEDDESLLSCESCSPREHEEEDAQQSDSDVEGCNTGDDDNEDPDDGGIPSSSTAGKLWSKAEFPEGMKGSQIWDLDNLKMAQMWKCPCPDRSCLGADRYSKVDPLYDFRKSFQTQSKGLRDTFRRKFLEPAYSSQDGTFSRSARIGQHNDNCIAAAGMAAGLSFGTFANARADVTRSRPYHKGRVQSRERKVYTERAHLDSYIRDLRSTMEGDKGGKSHGKWYTGKRSAALRWCDYKRHRSEKSLPIIGSESLFTLLWREHDEIVERGAIGHAKCVTCGKHDVEVDALEFRTDAVAVARRQELEALYRIHTADHSGERKYADNAWFCGETYPSRVTCIRIDAPTQHQFDLPRQRRIRRDIVKSLDGAKRWASKITGAQVAGAGMYAFIARAALGGGPNLVGTALLMVLHMMVQSGLTLGARLLLVLDNTCGENKCNAIIGLLAWLVHCDVFEETGFFSQPVGHTFNELDQSFNTLIKSMLQHAIYTVSRMARLMYTILEPYGIHKVWELPHLWDVSALVLPHMHELGGYATSQHGDGMHEFRLKKDCAGLVRLHMRKSSKSSGWLPEGQGYEVFKSTPPRQLEVASLKNDYTWHRSEVESTVRQWFPFMALSDADRTATKNEWTSKYFSLPPDMVPAQIPPAELLPQPQLPQRGRRYVPQQETRTLNPSARLENPDIDPTHGHGRTTADVQRETAEYRARAREEHQPTGATPVFQADFLLVQMPGVPLSLHSVCNGANLHLATEEDINLTTVEYTHVPQDSVAGMWGTFTKALNTRYDRSDARSGTKFVRHYGVTRDNIIVYNVKVWTDKSLPSKPLRVAVSSLKELAAVRPVEFAMPNDMPLSHTEGVRGQPNAAVPPRPINRSRARRRVVVEDGSDEMDDANGDDESDDPPAPIPEGFVQYAWDGQPIQDFYLWTSFHQAVSPQWHRGVVVAVLAAGNAGGFTHDAKFDRERYPRSTTLTAAAAEEGVLVLLKQVRNVVQAHQEHAQKRTKQNVHATSTASSTPVAHPAASYHQPSQTSQSLSSRQKRMRTVAFSCESCNTRNSDFLYCAPDSPDGVTPPVRCHVCAPPQWVTISHSDYLRSMP